MILLYHHVAPLDSIPAGESDGWRSNHSPATFERQLLELRRRSYRFVSLAELVGKISSQAEGRKQEAGI